MIHVKIKLLGVFRELSGRSQVTMKFQEAVTVRRVVQTLIETLPSEFKEAIIDPELDDPRPNALIIINGKEIGVLHGLQTVLDDDDEIILLPIAHGG